MKRLINQMQNLQRNEKKRYKGKPQNETQVKFYTHIRYNNKTQCARTVLPDKLAEFWNIR